MVIFLFLTLATLHWANTFLLLTLFIRKRGVEKTPGETFLLSALALGLEVVLITEGLSLFSGLNAVNVRLSWGIAFILTAGINTYLVRFHKHLWDGLSEEIRLGIKRLTNAGWALKLILGVLFLHAFVLLVIIFIHPIPNIFDSMTYHFGRMIYWEQQGNLAHYFTHDLRQITFPPFAEYAMFNAKLVMGSDHVTKLIQWLSMLVVLVGVSDVVKRLGGNSLQQATSALLAAALPMGIMQATNTKNDYVLSAWTMCLVVFGLAVLQNKDDPWSKSGVGAALGLTLLTKGTGYIYALPFGVWLGYRMLRTYGWGYQVWHAAMVVISIALIFNLGHYSRNIGSFGNPLGERHEEVNQIFGDRVLASNMIRNIQIHIIPEKKGFPAVMNEISRFLTGSLKTLHAATGLDPNDPRTTFVGGYTGFILPKGYSASPAVAGNFVHLLLIIFTSTYGLYAAKKGPTRQLIIVLVLTFILFSGLLKAQTHISRLQLPYFILWTPIISLALPRNKPTLGLIITLCVWILSLPWLVNNQFAPLLPQHEDHVVNQLSEGYAPYYISRPQFLAADETAAKIITEKGCSEVGYAMTVFEYPFWIILKENGFSGTVQHIDLQGAEGINFDIASNSLCAVLTHSVNKTIPGYDVYEFEKMNLFIQISEPE